MVARARVLLRGVLPGQQHFTALPGLEGRPDVRGWIDRIELGRFQHRVERRGDLGAAARLRAVVILGADDRTADRALGRAMPRPGSCRGPTASHEPNREELLPSVPYAAVSMEREGPARDVVLIDSSHVPGLAGGRWSYLDERHLRDFGDDWPAVVDAARAFATQL